MPSPKRRASPRQPASSWRLANAPVHRVAAAAHVGAVHDVVVHERERVHELERGRRRRSTRRVVGVAAGADERAVAERGPEPLAAGGDESRAARRAVRPARASTAAQRAISASRSRSIRASTRSATRTSAAGNVASRPVGHARRLSPRSAESARLEAGIACGRARVPVRRVARGAGRIALGRWARSRTPPRS